LYVVRSTSVAATLKIVSLYDSILFDFDGVLADSEPLHYRCWKEILAPYGIELEWDAYANNYIGVSDRVMLAKFCEAASPPVELQTLIDQYPRKRDRFRELMAREPPFFEGCHEFLETLSAYKLAVVSSSGRLEIEPPLERSGLRGFFRTLVCGGDVRNQKPAPDPYLLAAERLEARRPLVVEDSQAGVDSARAAGFSVIRVNTPAEVRAAVAARLEIG
jgi:beta-phosphoglucomutase